MNKYDVQLIISIANKAHFRRNQKCKHLLKRRSVSVLVTSSLRTSSVSSVPSFVGDLRPVSVFVGSVLHSLRPTVGKQDVVRALGDVSFAVLLMTELDFVFWRVDVVLELVIGWCLTTDRQD